MCCTRCEVEHPTMTADEVRAAAAYLEMDFERFSLLFGKEEARIHAFNYLKGLLVCRGRKSAESIARTVGQGRASGLQKFINCAPWEYDEVQEEIQGIFGEQLAASMTEEARLVAVLHDCGFFKRGNFSVGVERQFNARSGKVENCQVGMFLIGVAPGGSALLDHQLVLPSSWCDPTEPGRLRRAKVHVPEWLPFRDKTQVAADLVRSLIVNGLVRPDWITSGKGLTAGEELLEQLERLDQRYLLEVTGETRVWASAPPCWESGDEVLPEERWNVADLARRWPASGWFHQAPLGSEPAPSWTGSDFAAVRARPERSGSSGEPAWLLFQRPAGRVEPAWFYLSNAGPETSLDVLVRALDARERAADCVEETIRLLGLADYETRSWIGWHHHMSLVALARLIVTRARRPEFSLPSRSGRCGD